MKKILISLIICFAATISFAQTQTDSVSSVSPDKYIVYRLFPTTNMWTFIKLNTRTGQMWQVQYSVREDDDGYRYETYLSLRPLVPEEEEVNGRFTLYATQNRWTFILLDQIDGRMWQVQWSQEAEKRGIIPIE